MTKIVALANQKGGVGKTTTAINLGASVAACERRVLLVDLDPQSNASSGIGVTEADPSMYDVLIENMPLRDIIRPTEIPTLYLAPSSTDLVGAEVELRDAIGREYYLKRVLEPIAAEYDYILIDSPPSLGLLTVNGLTAANSVLVPLQAEYFALEGVSQLLATIDRVRGAVNAELEIEGIPRNIRLSEAPSFGKPIILYDIRSRGSEAYVSLAREFIQRAENVI
jgi:chromosome partitioning protein